MPVRIAFIPIDNRPVCYTLPQQIAEVDKDLELFLPPREMLGDLKKIADISGILTWLENLENLDKIIVSLDTIAYGGLIPSRRSLDKFDEIKTRMEKFKSVLLSKNAKIYAFSSIMRISNNNINEEEKEYWNLYGKKIFKYSFESHKNTPHGKVETDVPIEIIQDFIKTRKRNFDLNLVYLSWAEEGFFDTLVFSKDDCAKYGLNVAEAQAIENRIKKQNINALVKTGADEIPLSLLSRALTDGKKIKIAPLFMEPEAANLISKYEDVSVSESVKGQIELAGGSVCEEEDADMVLVVNNFKTEQGELVMGVEVEGFSKDLRLPKKPYVIADILNANGADNCFLEKFFEREINIKDFLGYAGWNTTGNTVGSALCCAIVKYLAKQPDTTAFKKIRTVRFLDDWAYQANVRKILKSRSTKINTNELESEMKIYEDFLAEKLGFSPKNISYTFPWGRFFEIEVQVL